MSLSNKILGIEKLDYDFEARKKRRGNQARSIEICTLNLLDTKAVLDSFNIIFWLMYGTLLGALREKSFISFDTDTDLGLFIESKPGFEKVIRQLIGEGFELIRTDCNDNLITVIRDDEYIDFSFFKKENLPFRKLSDYRFLAVIFKIPENSEQFLNELYGKDWSIPKRYKHATKYYGM